MLKAITEFSFTSYNSKIFIFILGVTHLTGENFLNSLDNGMELCLLATIIRDKAIEATEKGIYNGVRQ